MEWIIFLGAVAELLLLYFIAREFSRIAAMKGHTESRYFWWTFLLCPIGIFMVLALPDRGSYSRSAAGGTPERDIREDDLPALR